MIWFSSTLPWRCACRQARQGKRWINVVEIFKDFHSLALTIDSWDQYWSFHWGKLSCGNIAWDVICVTPPCYRPTRRAAVLVFDSDNNCVCRCPLRVITNNSSHLQVYVCLHRSSSLRDLLLSPVCKSQLCLISRLINRRWNPPASPCAVFSGPRFLADTAVDRARARRRPVNTSLSPFVPCHTSLGRTFQAERQKPSFCLFGHKNGEIHWWKGGAFNKLASVVLCPSQLKIL